MSSGQRSPSPSPPLSQRLVAGGAGLVTLRVAAALCAGKLAKDWVHGPLSRGLATLPPRLHETGDTKPGGALLVVALAFVGLLAAFVLTAVVVFAALSALPPSLQVAAGILLIVAVLALRSDRPGHFVPRARASLHRGP
jgi:hypothetical protein